MTKAEEILRKEITIIESSLQPDMQQMIRRSDALRAVEEAINYTHCCTELRDEYLQPELDKYKNIKIERTKGKSDM